MASGVHDAKNVIFDAQTRIAAARQSIAANQGSTAVALLDEVDGALDLVARGLSLALAAYRLDCHENPVVLLPTVVPDLLQEVVLRTRQPDSDPRPRTTVVVDCAFPGVWLLDRELIVEALVNAVRNAQRYARAEIVVSAEPAAGGLGLRVEDDGPGFVATHHEAGAHFSGAGLEVSQRVAQLHQRHGVAGRLLLADGGRLGGAVFSLWLPG
jgi:signal transduction histidine kinase